MASKRGPLNLPPSINEACRDVCNYRPLPALRHSYRGSHDFSPVAARDLYGNEGSSSPGQK